MVLSLFTIPKAFQGHFGYIQRNAIQSWTRLHPDIEIILFGDDEGTAQVAQDFGLRHEPDMARNEFGTYRVDVVFSRAQALARREVVCYVNCDIILMGDFCRALHRLRSVHPEFLMVGRRTDVDILGPWPFDDPQAEERLRDLALRSGRTRGPDWIDYFAFSRGLYGSDIPPFGVGRTCWDDWLVWKVLDRRVPVVDVSSFVLAVHQNHDYSHHPQGRQGVWRGSEAACNAQLAGGWKQLRTIEDSTEVLRENGLAPNRWRHWAAAKRYARQAGRVLFYDGIQRGWFLFLDLTRPLRRKLGLRAENLRRSRGKVLPPLG